MAELPTRTAMFKNTLAELDRGRSALSAAADWLRSDWTPSDAALTDEGVRARLAIMLATGALSLHNNTQV